MTLKHAAVSRVPENFCFILGNHFAEMAFLQSAWRTAADHSQGRRSMTVGTVLFIVLILLLIGALPSWNYSRNWGYAPTGTLGIILIIVIILLVLGKI
jgi:type VI protein secretion system component VasK